MPPEVLEKIADLPSSLCCDNCNNNGIVFLITLKNKEDLPERVIGTICKNCKQKYNYK